MAECAKRIIAENGFANRIQIIPKRSTEVIVGEGKRNEIVIVLGTLNIRKFQKLVTCQKGLDKQCRPRLDCFLRSSLIRVFPVCYSDTNVCEF